MSSQDGNIIKAGRMIFNMPTEEDFKKYSQGNKTTPPSEETAEKLANSSDISGSYNDLTFILGDEDCDDETGSSADTIIDDGDISESMDESLKAIQDITDTEKKTPSVITGEVANILDGRY